MRVPIAIQARQHGAVRPVRARFLARATRALMWSFLLSTTAIAQSSSANYELPRQSIDGGSTRTGSASYTVEATVGQPDAAPTMTSAAYELRGGFHRRVAGPLADPLFSNGFE